MKKRFLFLIISIFVCTLNVEAQRGIKIGYIDMDYILKNIPEYQEASQQLDSRVQKWKSEIELKLKAIEDMKQNLENERALLTKELIEEREEEIAYEEKVVLDEQQKRFGPQGDLITQKRQLIQPVQDQVFNAVQEIGDKRQYDFIFENSADALLLFSAKRHDISDQVLGIIQRASRKLDIEERKQERVSEVSLDEPYKSVEKAAADEAEQAEREALRQQQASEREAMMNERQRKRDSVRAARQKEYEERRARMLEERERSRNGIEQETDQTDSNNSSSTSPPSPKDEE